MSKSDGPKVVTALFSFKGKNNDELCFKKGDIITITQLDDGGWWEGTLNEKTGWFPSNYVKELKAPDSASTISAKLSPEKSSPDSPVHQTMNRDIVLKDIIDSERANVAELQGLVSNFLQPLETANILKKEEYKQLIGNIHEVLEAHQRLLANLDSVLPQGPEARVGNIFLTSAPKLKSIHTSYCNWHPQAVCILDRYRDELNEFMERSGAITPGILVLTTGLSKPFRRLDKYSAMLQELERHTEKNHSDRGDTQRSVSVYREIADRCAAIRKQRELALQILTCGIKGWEGEELSVLGDIIHVGPVILVSGVDRRDRYFVLFPMNLLVLSTSARMSSFVYEGKLPLTGINVVAVETSDDIKNAFEISGPMIESITVLCPSREERQHWIELLSQDEVTSRSASSATRSPTTSISHVSCCQHPPYTRLSRFFARLVRKKLLHPELLKRLLYFQYIFRPDLSTVKMRRNCLVTYTLNPRDHSQKSSTRKVSTLNLDVRYVPDDGNCCPLQAQRTHLPASTSTSMAVFSTEAPTSLPEPTSRSLPPKVSTGSCVIIPNFDSVPYRVLRSGNEDLSNLCDSEDSKNWKSLGSGKNQGKLLTSTRSPRSSDSGMADSFQYHSAEIGSCYNAMRESENEFESQCICTSPFGSTPSCKSLVDQPMDVSDDDGDDDDEVESLTKCTCNNNVEESRFAKMTLTQQKHLTQPLTPKKSTKRRPLGRYKPQPEDDKTDEPKVYTSTLYAHWWLKKTIPMDDDDDDDDDDVQGKRFSMAWLRSVFIFFTL